MPKTGAAGRAVSQLSTQDRFAVREVGGNEFPTNRVARRCRSRFKSATDAYRKLDAKLEAPLKTSPRVVSMRSAGEGHQAHYANTTRRVQGRSIEHTLEESLRKAFLNSSNAEPLR